MSGYYTGKIKVISHSNMMCFPAHPITLEPLACGTYDPYALTDPDTDPVQTMSYNEWSRKHHNIVMEKMRKERAEMNKYWSGVK